MKILSFLRCEIKENNCSYVMNKQRTPIRPIIASSAVANFANNTDQYKFVYFYLRGLCMITIIILIIFFLFKKTVMKIWVMIGFNFKFLNKIYQKVNLFLITFLLLKVFICVKNKIQIFSGARVTFGVFVGTSVDDAVPLSWAALQVYDWNERLLQVS